MNLGSALQEIRLTKEVTQQELCRRVGITINFLSQVEHGRKRVSYDVAERIAEVLEIPVSYLYLLADCAGDPFVKDVQDAVRTSLRSARVVV